MKVDPKKEKELLSILRARPSGGRGFYIGNCPFCGKDNKLSLVLGHENTSFKCFSVKCNQHGDIRLLLTHIGRLDLAKQYTQQINNITLDGSILRKKEIEESLPPEKKVLPLGFSRIYFSKYLKSRGFTKKQYEKYIVGITKIDIRFKNYLIFVIPNEEGEVIGYIGRSLLSKEEIDRRNIKRKEEELPPILRYINSLDTEFEKILFGSTEIIKGKTKIVILVEGITDKFNVEKLLELDGQDFIKCCCTFGKALTDIRIGILKEKEVTDIILIQDPDAVLVSKESSLVLENYFNSVKVGYIPFKDVRGKDKDPGNLTFQELNYVLRNLESPLSYFVNKVVIKKLKV